MLNIFTSVALVVLVYVTLGYVISLVTKRNDIADVMWGPGIFIAALTSFLSSDMTITKVIVLIVILAWALRIFAHIGSRYLGKSVEDFRYKTWRETWKYFYTRSYLQVFLLQGFLMILVASSSVLFFNFYNVNITNSFVFFMGIIISIFGLSFEATADMQLKRFLKLKKENLISDEIMKTGVWSYSRHPNYFGEVTFWWGIFIAALPAAIYNMNILFAISPLTITYLILYVSGIPMLEAKYIGNKEFEAYKKTTPAFLPKFW